MEKGLQVAQQLHSLTVSPEDRHVLLSLASENFVRDMDIRLFKTLIVQTCAQIGCPLPPTDLPISEMLHDFVCMHFPRITVESWKLAFQLNSAGKYKERVEHYQQFTEDYVGKILKAFGDYKTAAIAARKKAEEKQRHEKETINREEMPNEMSERMLKDHLKQMKEHKQHAAEFAAPAMVKYLMSEGKLADDMIPDAELAKWKKEARDEVWTSYQLTNSKWETIKQNPNEADRYNGYVQSGVYRRAYIWYLKEILKQQLSK